MESFGGFAALPMLTCKSLYVLVLVTSLLSRSVTLRPVTSSAVPRSHLLFYLAVEKELVPQTADLAERALHLLQLQCGQIHQTTSQCLAQADQLPAITALGDFPSRKTLQKEGTKMFTKYLLKEAYISVHKLQRLLGEENQEGPFQPVTELLTALNNTRHNLRGQIESLYRLRIRERKYLGLKNTKWRYTKRSKTKEGNCSAQKQDCLTQTDYRLRLLYTLYTRLLRVNHVLDYTVRLSWLALGHRAWS